MSPQRFKATVTTVGSRTFIPLPFDPNEVWGVKQRHHITGSVNGTPIRGPLDQEGTQWVLRLGPAWSQETGFTPGTQVEVVLDAEGPQVAQLAPDITVALEAETEAKAFFEDLATFYRKGYINWIESAKRPQTRAARIAETINLLSAGKKQK